jgi:hypothetical protein
MPQTNDQQHGAKDNKHWLEYAIFIFVVLATIGTVAAAYYARQQWLTAQDTEKRQLRAYVGFIAGGVENFGDAQKQVFKMTRKNYGLTPAYNVFAPPTVHDVLRIGAGLPITFSSQPPNIRETATLFPTGENHLNIIGTQMSQTQNDLARAGAEYNLVYYGIVHYTDAFGDPHYTRYCWLFKGPSMTEKDVDACLGHNDSN